MAANGGPGLKQDPVAPPTGDRGLSPLGWATGACRPLGGDRVSCPGRHMPPFPLSFEPKNLEKKTGVLAVLSHLFEMVEEHYYWVTYVWAKNATFGKPVIAVLSSGNL